MKYFSKMIQLRGGFEQDGFTVPKTAKAPIKDFKTFTDDLTLPSLAAYIELPYVVVDVDTPEEFTSMIDLLDKDNLTYGLMKSDKGGHFWFKTNDVFTNVTDYLTPLGIKIDIKCGGKQSMACIKLNNKEREWLRQPEPEELSFIPPYLIPFKWNKNENPDFSQVQQGERHQYMLSHVVKYKAKGLTNEQIKDMYIFLNTYVMKSNLDVHDIEAMTINNSYLDNITPTDDGKMSTELMAIQIIQTNKFYIDSKNNIYIWNGEVYVHSTDLYLETQVFRNFPALSSANRKEVMQKIQLLIELEKENYKTTKEIDRHDVVFKNGILNMYTKELRPISNEYFFTHRIPHEYNPDVYDEVVVNVIKKLMCRDSELETLLLQMIAYCMTKGSYYQKAFLLQGGGSNGKSVFYDMMINIFPTFSAVPLSEFNNSNAINQMVGKPINFVDDMGNRLPNNSTFKSIVAGMPVAYKKLYSDSGTVRLNTKLIFGCNELPGGKDKTYGMLRRWIIIPFNARFSKHDKDYDPFIFDKVVTESATQTLINMAVDAYKSLVDENGFIEAEESTMAYEDYQDDLMTSIKWFKAHEDLAPTLDLMTAYDNYVAWGKNEGGYQYPVGITQFENQINAYSPYVYQQYITGDGATNVKRLNKKNQDLPYFFTQLERCIGYDGDDLYDMYNDQRKEEDPYFTSNQFKRFIRLNTEYEFKPTSNREKGSYRALRKKKDYV